MNTDAALAEKVAETALSVAGVAALHGGVFGEVATYSPRRKLVGVRLDADACEVHITAEYPNDVRGVADGVRRAVQPLVPTPVVVTVEDVVATTTGGFR